MIFGFMGVIYMVWLYLTWLPAYLEHERGISRSRKRAGSCRFRIFFGTLGMLSSGFIADGLMRAASRRSAAASGRSALA